MIDYDDGEVELGAARRTVVTGFFDGRTEAETAAERLRALGLGGQVSVTEGASSSDDISDDTGTAARDDRGFFERLGDFLFPDEDRSTFAEGLSRGGYLVTATGLTSASYDMVMDTLEEAGAVDIDERAASWRSEGWSGGAWSSDESTGRAGSAGIGSGTGYASENVGGSSYASGATGAGNVGSELPGEGRSGLSGALLGASGLGASDMDRSESSLRGLDETVPIVEERLRVGKRDTSHGRVRVRSYVVEEPMSETVRLEEERVEVERNPVDRAVTGGEDLFRERTIEAEEYREEAVVAKEARVVEEVGLRRTHDSREETVSDTVRRTEVEIDDGRGMVSGSDGGSLSGGMRRPVTEVEAESGVDDDDEDDATGLTERDVNRP